MMSYNCNNLFQPFSRFVEIGRVVLINYGPDAGKLATIIDVVDNKRVRSIISVLQCETNIVLYGKVLVDGPQSVTGIHRQVIGVKRLSLTDIVVKIPRNSLQKNLVKAWTVSCLVYMG